MTLQRNKKKIALAFMVLLGIGYTLFNLHALLSASPERRVQFVPDDAFYYLVLARNFAQQGLWTFDSGVSLTAGFHPLHAYVLSALYWVLNPSEDLFVGLGMLLSCLSALPAVLLAAALVVRRGQLLPAGLLLLFLLSRNVSLNMTSGTEWGWAVSTSAFYCWAFLALSGPRHGTALAWICVLGFLGSLARTDFGGLPLGLFTACLPGVRSAQGAARLRGAAAGLVAASLGVVAGLLHNHWMTGQLLQSSAQMKGLWFATSGPSVSPLAYVLGCLFGQWTSVTRQLIAVLAVCALASGYLAYRRVRTQPALAVIGSPPVPRSQEAFLWLGCWVTLVGYVAFYALNPVGIQHWYTANLVVPLFLVLVLPSAHSMRRGPVFLGAALSLLLLLVGQIQQAYHFLDRPEWPHQVSLYRAGRFLANTPLPGRVGSWNAGILGYYEGGRVVNLDGLVNNGIYEYAAQGRLPEYIDATGLQYIVDYERMLSEPDRRERGGYDSDEFIERLTPIKRFDDSPQGWKELTLFELAPRGSRSIRELDVVK